MPQAQQAQVVQEQPQGGGPSVKELVPLLANVATGNWPGAIGNAVGMLTGSPAAGQLGSLVSGSLMNPEQAGGEAAKKTPDLSKGGVPTNSTELVNGGPLTTLRNGQPPPDLSKPDPGGFLSDMIAPTLNLPPWAGPVLDDGVVQKMGPEGQEKESQARMQQLLRAPFAFGVMQGQLPPTLPFNSPAYIYPLFQNNWSSLR